MERGKERELKFMTVWMRKNKDIFAIMLFVGFTSCIYAPYEMFLNNASDFWFSILHFWWIPLVCGGFAMGVGAIVGCALKGYLRRIYEGLVFGFGLAVYLQGNFLNLDVGLMDGTAIEWSIYQTRFVINGIIWGLCICIPVGVLLFF